MNGYNPELLLQQQQQQQNGHRGINFNNFSSTSPFPFSSQQINGSANMNSQMRPPQSPAQVHPFDPINHTHAQHAQASFNPSNNAQWGTSMPQQWPQMNGMNAVMNGSNMMPNMPMNMNFPPFNMATMPMFPQQMLDAFALSQSPVAGEDDEKLLLDTLMDATQKRESYKNALNRLHARNGHAASLWKDFYLEHRERIDAQVSLGLKTKAESLPVVKAVKKPTIESFHPEPSPPLSPAESRKRDRGRPPKASTSGSSSKSSKPLLKLGPTTTGRRSTINSITTHTASYNARLPAPNAELKIPDPPSRSPSPPTRVVPGGRGNRFTVEDKAFFISFLSWRLKCDPGLTRNGLCEQLAEKCPQHPFSSWYAYWSNNHDLPDKILAAAYGEAEGEADDESSEEEQEDLKPLSRPKYKVESSSEEEEDTREVDEDDDLSDKEFTLPSFNESEMGPKGGPFTKADLALTSRYVASFDDFASASFAHKWQPWSQRHPQRSAKAWGEYYRRCETDILALAKKIRKAGAARGISPKREPSESSALTSSPDVSAPPKTKRKFVPDEETSDSGSRVKMGKIE